jgi:3-oxoacyl-[acyl-carrier-protein] synthase-3
VLGLGRHLPGRIVTNDEIAPGIDSSDEWIRDRSGIVTRRFADDHETVASMAIEASCKAIAAAGVDASDVDLVIVATCTTLTQVPGAAAEVAAGIGATTAGALDIGAACAGFCYALGAAADAVRSGSARHVVVVGSEKLSDILDLGDRGTAFLFGDGAGAAVVGPAEEPGIGPIAWGSDGAQSELITAKPLLRMEGPAVFRWAVTQLAPVARRACELAGVRPEELAAFVPHQANARIVDGIARALRLPESVVVARDVVDVGNTSSASVPLALTRIVESGAVDSGAPALLMGFGAGLTYAAQVVLVP